MYDTNSLLEEGFCLKGARYCILISINLLDFNPAHV